MDLQKILGVLVASIVRVLGKGLWDKWQKKGHIELQAKFIKLYGEGYSLGNEARDLMNTNFEISKTEVHLLIS